MKLVHAVIALFPFRMKLSHAVIALLLPASALVAQQPAPDTTKPAPPPPATPAPAAVSIPVDFSGVLYANFQYRGDKGTSKSQNKFDVERAYLTFRMPAGDRARAWRAGGGDLRAGRECRGARHLPARSGRLRGKLRPGGR